jgi:hypothetical protein
MSWCDRKENNDLSLLHNRPVRDSDSSTYIGITESSELLGLRIDKEALRRGCE